MKKWNRFTLIELLVVVAIIAILAAMLLPALRMPIPGKWLKPPAKSTPGSGVIPLKAPCPSPTVTGGD